MRDFSKYQGWINELCPMLGTADFDARFKQLTGELPRAEAFQLKMEIKRLGKPCYKTIDLRGKVDGKCEAIDIAGRTHYLDEVAKTTLSELLIAYNGKITEAVYDAMQNTENNYRVMRRKEEEDKKTAALHSLGVKTSVVASQPAASDKPTTSIADNRYVARFSAFGTYHRRSEERMLYVTKLLVFKDAEKQPASSMDISPNGLKVKLTAKQEPFAVGDEVRVKFSQLREEFAFKHYDKIRFKVVSKVLSGKGECVYGLLLIPHAEHAEYQQIVTNLITGNKFRYKINTGNVEDALLQRAYEYQSIATTSVLPLFCQRGEGHLQLKYTLQNSKTESTMNFFDLAGRNQLESIFTSKRLEPLFGQAGKIKECVLFAFTVRSENGTRLFAAFDFELVPSLRAMFFYYARNQSDFRQFVVKATDIDGSHHNIPSVLADDVSKEVKLRNAPLAPKIAKMLLPINTLISLTEVTQDRWQMWEKVAGDYRQLLKFVVKKVVKSQLQVIPREFIDKRLEPRYEMKTKALLKTHQNDIEAFTADFSQKGLRLLCNEPVKLNSGDIAHLELTQFQNMTKVFKLKTLPYEVINVTREGKQLHLKAVPNEKGLHVGSLFFRQLIRSNSDKLKTNDIAEVQELSSGLTNLLIRNQMQAVSFLELDKDNHLGISTLMTNSTDHPLLAHCPSSEVPHVGTCVDLNNAINARRISLIQEKIKRRSNRNHLDLIFVIKSAREVDVRHDEEFKSVALMRAFIEHAHKSGHKVVVLRVLTSPVFRYNPDFFKLELQYLRRYSPHRADLILKQISAIKGVTHIFEITRAFLAPLRQVPGADFKAGAA